MSRGAFAAMWGCWALAMFQDRDVVGPAVLFLVGCAAESGRLPLCLFFWAVAVAGMSRFLSSAALRVFYETVAIVLMWSVYGGFGYSGYAPLVGTLLPFVGMTFWYGDRVFQSLRKSEVVFQLTLKEILVFMSLVSMICATAAYSM